MSATTSDDLKAVANAGDEDIDGILWTTRWAVADFKMTYSFPSIAADYDTGAPGGKYPNQKAITDNSASSVRSSRTPFARRSPSTPRFPG
jgi:hypothetical protein